MKLERGQSCKIFWEKFDLETPEIRVTGSSNPGLVYLWIGGEKGPCYATLQGKTKLRKLAKEILKAIGEE